MSVKRIYVEKKPQFSIKAKKMKKEIVEDIGVESIKNIRVLNRYDVEGITDDVYEKAKYSVFSEPLVDYLYEEDFPVKNNEHVFAFELLSGQYDQQEDSFAQCIQLISMAQRPKVQAATVIVIEGDLSGDDLNKIKGFYINPVESKLAGFEKPSTLHEQFPVPDSVHNVKGFINSDDSELRQLSSDFGFAMSDEDLFFCRDYFKNIEKRDPTVTELKVIDTYWSDHCRHTTFSTQITDVTFDKEPISQKVSEVYQLYHDTRKNVYKEKEKAITLMDLATLGMKELKRTGHLQNLDESDEINACSIVVDVDIDGKNEPYLIMFKNETHNHPTEIEPFGGASTCLGGAIRDPLSGRSYVYQAMRITGCGDPRKPLDQTLPGKLPQRVITTKAAQGYSSYGNQIGIAAGQVNEIYHEGYVAKRMELGAVIAAVPKANVRRERPEAGDVVILLGGKTGRDGCGGATGSSKEHTEDSLTECGAEVQKGNPPIERYIQRLFRDPEVTKLIKKCNDFGAGGVSVAIGELADGLEINLDVVPTKYDGLDGTELAISESQERMAVVVAKEDAKKFIELSHIENLESTVVANVTDTNRLIIKWRGDQIVNISRDFLDSNGVQQKINVAVKEPSIEFEANDMAEIDFKTAFKKNLERLNVCSQKGLIEIFDSTIGANTVLMPLGGKNQLTPAEGMAAKVPVENGETKTGTLMSFGFNPDISTKSPFHGAIYAVVESVAKIVAMGGNYREIRLTFQEYFEKLGKDPAKWGKPFSALLGAFYAQMKMKIPSIGGKDSMSGTFNDLDVPPTLVSFAVCTADVTKVLSPEFKKADSTVVLLNIKKDKILLPDFEHLDKTYSAVHKLISDNKVLSACSVKYGGIAEAISIMAFGNDIGFVSFEDKAPRDWFSTQYGNIILEISTKENIEELFSGLDYKILGHTSKEQSITIKDACMDLNKLKSLWQSPLESVFPTSANEIEKAPCNIMYDKMQPILHSVVFAKPRVLIPVFPGTNSEYDLKKAFEKAGATTDIYIMKNMNPANIEESINIINKKIQESQIIVIPDGLYSGDEPGGSGKFIANVFRNPILAESIMEFLKVRDGLMLGIGGGFQALLKLGLLPYGKIREMDENSPTLTSNIIARNTSSLVRTKVVSSLSPWLSKTVPGDIHTVALSHGEGRFVANDDAFDKLIKNAQIATQYVDLDGNPTYNIDFNPNGSIHAVEGITSPDGRIFGKMGHSERYSDGTFKNVPGEMDQKIFDSGVGYFKY